MMIPDIHLLRAAVMLSEVRNYSRAARKLGIQQPSLTKRIVELEHLVGVQLFLRTTQFVEPTDACQQLVEEAKRCIFHAERALHVARLADRGAQTILHIGKSQYTDPYLTSVLSAVSLPLYPNLEVSLSSRGCPELEAEVLLGTLDLAVAIGGSQNPKITQLELMRTPFYIAMREDSDLAKHRELTLTDLRDRSWLLFERFVHPVLYDQILQMAKKDQIIPRLIRHVVTAEEAAQELYAGSVEAAFLTRAGSWRIAKNGLTMRPLNHPDLAVCFKLIARSDERSRLVSEFVRSVSRTLASPRRIQLNLPLQSAQSL